MILTRGFRGAPRLGRSVASARFAMSLVELIVVIGVIGVLLALLCSAIQAVRIAAARTECSNKVRQIGLALHQFHDTNHSFPPGVTHPLLVRRKVYGPDTDPFPLLNWPARLLPFVEQTSLWAQTVSSYAQDPRRTDDRHHPTFYLRLPLFQCPADQPRSRPHKPEAAPGTTSYVGVAGTSTSWKDGVFYLDSAVRMADITDGASATVIVGERPPHVGLGYGRWYGGWGRWPSADSFLGVRETRVNIVKCPSPPYPYGPGVIEAECDVYHFWSLHPGGGHFLFADGSVRFLTYDANPLLPALATRAGREVAALP